MSAGEQEDSIVTEHKTRGNTLYRENKYEEAAAAYSEGLSHAPKSAILLCNRSACHQKLENFEAALADAQAAAELAPEWAKAYYRVGVALSSLHRYAEAVETLQMAVQRNPDSSDVAMSKKLRQARKRQKHQEKEVQLAQAAALGDLDAVNDLCAVSEKATAATRAKRASGAHLPLGATKPLIAAAAAGHNAVVQALLGFGADVAGVDNLGRTPIWHAANGTHVDAYTTLLQAGADPNVKDADGVSAKALLEQSKDAVSPQKQAPAPTTAAPAAADAGDAGDAADAADAGSAADADAADADTSKDVPAPAQGGSSSLILLAGVATVAVVAAGAAFWFLKGSSKSNSKASA